MIYRNCIRGLLFVTTLLLLALPALAVDRERTLEELESLLEGHYNSKLQAWLNDNDTGASNREENRTPLATSRRYQVQAAERAYLTCLHINPYGVLTILPSITGEDGKIDAGRAMSIPPDTVKAQAELPLGDEDLFVLLTRQPVAAPDSVEERTFDETRSRQAVAEIVRQADAAGLVAAAHVPSRVVGRIATRGAKRPDVLAEDIVRFFSSSTRSWRKQRSSFPVFFDLNSADLFEESKRQLDEVAKALGEKKSISLMVAGHTDARGDERFNLNLSQRRAVAVRDYLIAEHGIAPGRLTPKGFGFSQPLRSGTDEQDHRMNRRVEFQLMDP